MPQASKFSSTSKTKTKVDVTKSTDNKLPPSKRSADFQSESMSRKQLNPSLPKTTDDKPVVEPKKGEVRIIPEKVAPVGSAPMKPNGSAPAKQNGFNGKPETEQKKSPEPKMEVNSVERIAKSGSPEPQKEKKNIEQNSVKFNESIDISEGTPVSGYYE